MIETQAGEPLPTLPLPTLPLSTGGTELRIDPPHVLNTVSRDEAAVSKPCSEDSDDAAAGSPQLALELIQQLRSQAEQLSLHLRVQEKDLTHRESQLNASLAQLENEARSARLWLRERHQELDQRGAELTAREQSATSNAEDSAAWSAEFDDELQQARAELAAREAVVTRREAESAANSARLTAAETQLQHRQQRLVQDLRSRNALPHHDSDSKTSLAAEHPALSLIDLEQALAQFTARQQYLEQAETLLTEGQQRLTGERAALAVERRQQEEQLAQRRRELAEDQRGRDAELEKQRQALETRSQQLDSRYAALEQSRADLERMHRESLEMRLATEEIWAQLSGRMAPADLTQSLARIRSRLAEQYRLTGVELNTQREELQDLAARVAEQHKKLAQQRRELQVWLDSRQTDIEDQATRLVAQEQHLRQQQSEAAGQADQWAHERRKLQDEIRRLLGELRRSELRPTMAA